VRKRERERELFLLAVGLVIIIEEVGGGMLRNE
jgi:hypothetical protein